MHDIGLEAILNWRTLALWHGRMARNVKDAFGKAPAPKNRLPQFFSENPDAQEAFKTFGVQNLKELSVELMHEYVLDELVPRLLVRSISELALSSEKEKGKL
jgi:hypothetical protein